LFLGLLLSWLSLLNGFFFIPSAPALTRYTLGSTPGRILRRLDFFRLFLKRSSFFSGFQVLSGLFPRLLAFLLQTG